MSNASMAKRKPRQLAMPAWLAAGIERTRREAKARETARPMRELFAVLKTGEVLVISDKPVMSMPELDPALRQANTDWVEIAPAVFGWIDVWARLTPDLSLQRMRYLGERLRDNKPLTLRLVEQAEAEFNDCIARIPALPAGAIRSAISTAQIAWAFEEAA